MVGTKATGSEASLVHHMTWDHGTVDRCIAREHELASTVSVAAAMASRPPVSRLRYFHAVTIEAGNPAAETACGQRFDDIDVRIDWQEPILHTAGERCPECLDSVPVAGQPYGVWVREKSG